MRAQSQRRRHTLLQSPLTLMRLLYRRKQLLAGTVALTAALTVCIGYLHAAWPQCPPAALLEDAVAAAQALADPVRKTCIAFNQGQTTVRVSVQCAALMGLMLAESTSSPTVSRCLSGCTGAKRRSMLQGYGRAG